MRLSRQLLMRVQETGQRNRAWRGLVSRFARWGADRRATTAVEFALLALPFFMVLLGTMQVGLIYLAQTTLQSATLKAAESMLTTKFSPVPTISSIRTILCANSANIFACDGTLKVELNTLQALSTGTTALSDGLFSIGSNGTPLVLRTQTTAAVFVPGLGSTATVYASSIVRRP